MTEKSLFSSKILKQILEWEEGLFGNLNKLPDEVVLKWKDKKIIINTTKKDKKDKWFRQYYINQQHEGQVLDLFLSFAKNSQAVLDVGASFGFYSLFASRVVENKIPIHSFECDPKSFNAFLKNIERNSIKNIIPRNVALMDFNEQASFFSGQVIFSSVEYPSKEKIRCIRLDDYCEKMNFYPDLVKIDVEGAEMNVLLGGEKTLKKTERIACFCEIHHSGLPKFGYRPNDVLKFFRKNGMETYEIKMFRKPRIEYETSKIIWEACHLPDQRDYTVMLLALKNLQLPNGWEIK